MENPKILIVDDEPNIRDLLTTSLRFSGFTVQAVGNGAAAISAVLAEEPDLIVLDVMLPDMNGFRSEERRVGKECWFECRSRWSPYH
jgi:two-component system OmpR family response regulator